MKKIPKKDISKVLALKLETLRKSHNMTVYELSKKCRVSRQTIYNIESGDEWISKKLLNRLCSIYKVDSVYLFQDDTLLYNN